MAKQYRWTSAKPLARPNASLQGSILLPGPDSTANHVKQGQVFEPTEAELKAFADRIEEVKEGDKK